MAALAPTAVGIEEPKPQQPLSLAERQTDELVIGLVGPVGSGVSTTALLFKEIMEDEYGYKSDYYKVSEIITEIAHLVETTVPTGLPRHERTSRLQTVGTKLRDKFGDRYVAERCVERIATGRLEGGGYETIDG
jgi:hypothetical protein